MISRRMKSFYYTTMSVPLYLSALVYRKWLAQPKDNTANIRVHLGPGQKGYKRGWINVDANIVSTRVDVWADLRNELPFNDNSVDVFYSHHVIERLPDS